MRTIVISPVVVFEDGDKELPFGTFLLVLALRHICDTFGKPGRSSPTDRLHQVLAPSGKNWEVWEIIV